MKTRNLILAIIALAMLGLASCKKETITLSSCDVWFPTEADTAFIDINADCDWSLSIDDNADWYSVAPTNSDSDNIGQLVVIAQPMENQEIRNSSFTILSKKGKTSVKVNVTQQKETITLSDYELWFPKEAGSKSIEIKANCKWTVGIDDGADWYTVAPMSGEPTNQGSIVVTTQAFDGNDFRSSSFTITSEHGRAVAKVYLSQNKLEFDEIINLVFGVSKIEHWNTDFFGQMIEDSYKHKEYDPFDTTKGYMMYFFEDGHGVQRDHHKDTVVYYAFTYDYNPSIQNLHIEFETVYDTLMESYDASVLTASEALFRFMHEYKPNWWERADMRKIGTITPDEKSSMMRAATKRKGKEGIFSIR